MLLTLLQGKGTEDFPDYCNSKRKNAFVYYQYTFSILELLERQLLFNPCICLENKINFAENHWVNLQFQ
jgi:hypothetical protein